MAGIVSTTGKSLGRVSWFSILGLFKFIWRHWYLFTLLFVLIPPMIVSINSAIEEKNPLVPFVDLAKHIFAADIQLKEDIKTLETNPSELVGVEKPTEGIWNKTKYYWLFFWNVIFRLFSSVYLIFLPAVITYKLIRVKNTSEVSKNVMLSILIFLFYLFIINCIFVVYNIAIGETQIAFPKDGSEIQNLMIAIKNLAPFNGLFALIKYIVFSIIA